MYDWDEEKRAANLAKHGVDFAAVYLMQLDRQITKTQVVDGEVRFATLAKIGDRLHMLIWTLREGVIRVISLRKANKRENRRYG